MYSTCLFCAASLGANEVIERFPVGRRLAFDAAKGRLWVVCLRCRRWNLTPLEERWEAIEDAERLFRDSRLRVSTGQIGLARLREGLELVRVGEPLRPEIAAWRYAEQFSMRRRKQLVAAGGIIAGGGVLLAGGVLYAGLGWILAYQMGKRLVEIAEHGFPDATVARVRDRHGRIVRIRQRDLAESTIHRGEDDGLAFRLAHPGGRVLADGQRARLVAPQVFAGLNRRGGTPDDVELAVKRLEHAGGSDALLQRLVREPPRRGTGDVGERARTIHDGASLSDLSTSLGLAVEMALNEEQERLALEGELEELEAAWREAEEIGAIADSLFLPEPVERALARLKGSQP